MGINSNSYYSALSPVRHDASAEDEAHREDVLHVTADEEIVWMEQDFLCKKSKEEGKLVIKRRAEVALCRNSLA